MKQNELFQGEATANGFRVRALLENGILWVQVDEQELQFPKGATQHSKAWLIRSRINLVLPTTRAQAQKLIELHTDAYDTSLRASLRPLWELWAELPIQNIDPPARVSPAIN
jgi:hypothetical protein